MGGLLRVQLCISGVAFLACGGAAVLCLWTRLGGILNVSYSLGWGKPIGCDPEGEGGNV
jgi:hypothetical protein